MGLPEADLALVGFAGREALGESDHACAADGHTLLDHGCSMASAGTCLIETSCSIEMKR